MKKKRVKCPQIMQMEALECGAASLAMVMAYHGRWVPLEQLRSDCGVSRDGSNAKNVLVAARSYGLTAKGFRMEPEGLKKLPTPSILFWNFNHFVVFRGFKKNAALINDPGKGSYACPLQQFNKAFTGVVLTFEPTGQFQKGGKPRSILAFAKSRMKGMLLPFIFVLLAGIISTFTGIISPVLSRIFMDRVLGGTSPGWLPALLLIMLATAVIQLVVNSFQSLYLLKIRGKFAVSSGASFLWHVLRLPLEFFSQRMAGDIMMRQSTNRHIATTLLETFAPQLWNIVMLVFYLCIMLTYSVPLTLVGITALVLNSVLSQVIAKKQASIMQVYSRDAAKAEGSVLTGINMIETLKATGAEDAFFERCAGYQAATNTSVLKSIMVRKFLGGLPGLCDTLCRSVILGMGVYFIMQGNFTMGMLLAFQSFLGSFMAPVSALTAAGGRVQEMRVDMERIEDVLKYPEESWPSLPAARAPLTEAEKTASGAALEESGERERRYKKLSGELSLRNLSFGYSRLAPPIIENFSMELKPGKSVAFVGSSGCGKSTLAKLISGLYRPWSGEILFDGVNMEKIPREIITGSVAVVDQDITIFGDSITNNLKMWDRTIEDFEMILAARDAQIHQDVMLRENGYNYRMREGGLNFSGGQRQRLEIARVLAQDPTLVIMDEATSALDAKTEQAVVQAIKDRGITCIFIAHRLSTIRDCDEIVVLHKGRVVERGKHMELLSGGGFYTRLVADQ